MRSQIFLAHTKHRRDHLLSKQSLMAQSGYTLMELLVVIIVITVIATTLIINVGPMVVSLDVDQVAEDIYARMANSRRAALSGALKDSDRLFDVTKAVQVKHPGIVITTEAATGANTQCSQSSTSRCTGPNSLCIDGRSFCYTKTDSFSFDKYSGNLSAAHAIFVISKSRKLAVLASETGHFEIVEMINGEWKSRNPLRDGSTK